MDEDLSTPEYWRGEMALELVYNEDLEWRGATLAELRALLDATFGARDA